MPCGVTGRPVRRRPGGDCPGAGFGIGYGVEPEFIGIAGWTNVSDVTVAEPQAETIQTVDGFEFAKAVVGAEPVAKPGTDLLNPVLFPGGQGFGVAGFIHGDPDIAFLDYRLDGGTQTVGIDEPGPAHVRGGNPL